MSLFTKLNLFHSTIQAMSIILYKPKQPKHTIYVKYVQILYHIRLY